MALPPAGSARRAAITAAVAGLGLLFTACSGSAAPDETVVPAGPVILAIGDSIPYNSPNDCPGCTGFVASYAEPLSEQSGEQWLPHNRSRHDGAGTADIVEQLESGDLDDDIAIASIVIVSIGLNDQPPYVEPGAPCSGFVNTEQDAIEGVLATTPECLDEQTAVLRGRLAMILSSVRALAADADILAMVGYNSWTGWSTLEAAGPETSEAVTDVIVGAIERWRDAVCEEAAAVDGECVDLYGAFNGPDGRAPSGGLLAPDYSHPSQEGNDLIRDLLLEVRPA
jgi:lysophospholipase L1-like esterase